MTAPAIAMSRSDGSPRTLGRSPGLGQFRKSPFRVLRLAAGATAQQAVWQCDKALARARVGMSLPDPDPLPWLAPSDEIEIQEAAQTMESPLARLVEQLLWFDVAGDPDGAELFDALTAGDGARLRAYASLAREAPGMAHAVNQANLRLLLGISALREVGPVLATRAADAAATLPWRERGTLSLVEDPHKLVASPDASPGTASWATFLGDGLGAWGALLASPAFGEHVRAKIAALGDELLTADDFEAVVSALRARLTDLVVGETKIEMAEGRIPNVAQLSAIAGKSQIDPETWLVAFRPLRAQFQAELAELAPDAETGLGTASDVDAYLDRLSTLADRWRPLDEAQLLGLSSLIDEAVSEAFGRLRGMPREGQFEPRFQEVLDRIGKLAVSASIKERVKGYKDRLADIAKAMCHFCGKRELDASACASVSSQKEISRERYGNTTRIQYQVGARPVARCQRCATLHGFVRSAGSITFMTFTASVVLLTFVHPDSWFKDASVGIGAVLLGIGILVAWGVGFIGREVAASVVTPKGERKFSDYMQSPAVIGLQENGFYSMKYDFRPNAWELVNQQGVKKRHEGGDAGVALKNLLYLGLFIMFIALRVCAGH